MRNIMNEAPRVAEGFFKLTKDIKGFSPMDEKMNELILIGIFTANRGLRGINTHVNRALEAGATKEEVLSAVLLALPAIGISNVTLAFEKALEVINQKEGE
ncbi:carboxymuconolactone decarboxylase family protein [Bacillus cytotoxicus]